jgi:biotin carboxyl carrier protein
MKIRIDNKEYIVNIEEKSPNKFKINFDEQLYDVELIPDDLKYPEKKTVISTKEKIIKAPFAGIITTINIIPGKKVEKNNVLLILTSMKMDNEIVSPEKCLVKEVYVKKNQQVREHEPLLCVEMDPSTEA